MDTRLRNLLHDLANEMPVDVEGSKRRTLRRARGRRALTAAAGVAVVLALVAVSVSALQLVEPSTPQPTVTGPNPARAFEGLWPETDAEALAATQASVDQGHMPLRTTPEGTATLLATNLLGWNLDDVLTAVQQQPDAHAVVLLVDRTFADDVPPIAVQLRQLGNGGPNGVWSVVVVSTPLVELGDLSEVAPGVVHVSGRVSELFDGAPALEAHVFDGPTFEPSLGFTRYEFTDRTFRFDVKVSPTPDGQATLLLSMPDAGGASLGAVMVPVETPVGASPSAGPDLTGVPADVAVTAQRIYDAAKTRDFDALERLIDPNTFVFNFDDGSNPLDAWRADPSVLDTMVRVLLLPASAPVTIKGYGTLYIWPYLKDSDFGALTARERSDLASLGYGDRDIRLMIEGGHGYQGPRLAIDATGLWRSYTTMGE
ncbi:MAG TPA: hypothetical protein VFM81_11340 [Actinomycetota bacterium]|nr:hypothetical protein [Actinomycetota bacterium]